MLRERLQQAARGEGFLMLGVTPAVTPHGFSDLVRWIDAGYAGQMDYFRNRQDAYRDPSMVLEGVQSLIALAYPYPAVQNGPLRPGEGRIARYVGDGVDYHDHLHPKLKRLCKVIEQAVPESRNRGVVDTAPLMEREVAQAAGLGWTGKNTLLLNKHVGSYFFLACLLTDVELPADQPHEASHCGRCTACLDACPTDAFPTSGVLDATRCISYLTIEHRGPIPMSLREGIGDWLFGCDVCQEVCPWNRKPARQQQPPEEMLDRLPLESLFDLDEEQFRARFRRTPLWRTRRRGILRNAAIVLGNQRRDASSAALWKGLRDEEPLVRGASAWALGRIVTEANRRALMEQMERESDQSVRAEIEAALAT